MRLNCKPEIMVKKGHKLFLSKKEDKFCGGVKGFIH